MPIARNSVSLRHQRGAALFTALMFLVVLTLISLAAMRSSTLEMRMATNDEARLTAFQRTQAVIDATIAEPDNMKVIGAVGRRTCTGASASDTPDGLDCDVYDIDLADDTFDADVVDGITKIAVTRLSPAESPAPRSLGTSAAVYSVATFKVDAAYDATEDGLGRGRIVEGVMVLISK
jgi:Tfp pilus assembly protein PilX